MLIKPIMPGDRNLILIDLTYLNPKSQFLFIYLTDPHTAPLGASGLTTSPHEGRCCTGPTLLPRVCSRVAMGGAVTSLRMEPEVR